MKIIFKFLLFMILFNIAAVLIAASGFFGENTLYSDIVSDNPNELISIEAVMNNLFRDEDGSFFGIDVPLLGRVEFTWELMTIGILAIAISISAITRSTPTVIPAGIVGAIFIIMWVNTKKTFDQITSSMDSIVLYIVLMIGVGFFFFALITIMDYLSGQDSGT